MSDTPDGPSKKTSTAVIVAAFVAGTAVGSGTTTLRQEMKAAAVYGDAGSVVPLPPPPVLLHQEVTTARVYGQGL